MAASIFKDRAKRLVTKSFAPQITRSGIAKAQASKQRDGRAARLYGKEKQA